MSTFNDFDQTRAGSRRDSRRSHRDNSAWAPARSRAGLITKEKNVQQSKACRERHRYLFSFICTRYKFRSPINAAISHPCRCIVFVSKLHWRQSATRVSHHERRRVLERRSFWHKTKWRRHRDSWYGICILGNSRPYNESNNAPFPPSVV